MRNKPVFLFLLLMIWAGSASSLFAQDYIRYLYEIDTPTAFTLERGSYQFSLLAYDEGGVEFKTFIGLHDNVFLGVSFDMEHAIGKDKPDPNVPGVIARLKITDGWQRFPISIAFGYDSFYMGSLGKIEDSENDEEYDVDRENTLNRMIYGPYFVITKPIYLFDDEQHISGGMRLPVQPDYVPEDTSYFFSLDIPLGEYFTIKGETERVYYNFHRNREWLYSAGLRYSPYNKIGVECNVIFQRGEIPNRTFRIEYTSQF